MKQYVAIDDMLKIKDLSNLALSPSGTKAAFTVREGDLAGNRYKTDIWVYDEAHHPPLFRLTAGEDGSAPVFLDDDTILFRGDRKKRHPKDAFGAKTTYNRISLSGGEAEEAFWLPFAASSPTPLPNGLWLFAGKRDLHVPDDLSTLSEDEIAALKCRQEERKDFELFEELPFWFQGSGIVNRQRTGLFLCDLTRGTQTLLTPHDFHLIGFRVNADGTKVAYWGTEYQTVRSTRTRLYVRDLGSGEVTEAATNGEYIVTRAQFIGDRFFFLGNRGEKLRTTQNDDLVEMAPDGSLTTLARPDLSFRPVICDIAGRDGSWDAHDAFYFADQADYRSHYRRMDADGTLTMLVDELPVISAAVGPADNVFFIGMETDGPQEFYRKKNGRVEKLSSFNDAYLASRAIGRTEHFTFRAREGVEIDSFVLYPPDFDAAKTYPGILTIHGGPRNVYGSCFYHEFQYWAGLGYVVFFCNPPGSGGKGDDFADILGDKFGKRDFDVLMEFTDEVLRRVPQIDPARLGVMGGSFGGFMTNWIIGHTDRFKAAISCRGMSNLLSDCLSNDTGYWFCWNELLADPWQEPEVFWRHSPVAYADRVKTPTLFIQSDQDYRCWMGDAVQMLHALLLHGVPAKMCLFHGETHELPRNGQPKHRMQRLREMAAWFNHYLMDEA